MKFKRKCILVYGIAPEGLRIKDVNHALNEWIKNRNLGKIIYHEHFSNKPFGGIAIFEVNTQEELLQLNEEPSKIDSYLHNWIVSLHPLIHSDSIERFVFQTQYTLAKYGGINMTYKIDD